MIISVTQNHIDRSQTNSCKFCPVAIALQEAVPRAFTVSVHNYEMTAYYQNTGMQYYHVPRSVKRFIKNYDHGGKEKVKPFNFRLTPKFYKTEKELRDFYG